VVLKPHFSQHFEITLYLLEVKDVVE